MNRANIPRQNSDLGGGSPPSREWYNFFRRVGDFVNRAELGGTTINQGDTIINNGTGSIPVGVGYDEGTSFPQTASVGQKFYRTDLNWLCFYDGTRWLTCHEYVEMFSFQDRFAGSTTNPQVSGYVAIRSDHQIYITKVAGSSLVLSSNDGSNYWSGTIYTVSNIASPTSIGTFSTIADSNSIWTSKVVNINQAIATTEKTAYIYLAQTGTAGGVYCALSLYYRLIVT